METNAGSVPQRWQPGPMWTLVFLAPFIAEVSSGATKLSIIFVLIPEMMVWGCGALIIRELVRRWGGGWPSLLALGLGLSIAEEFIVQQTSLAPLPFPGALLHYGRAGGVNWIYFLFMLGFESVWVVLVPVGVTELIFKSRSRMLWLRTKGMGIAAIIFLLGARIAWYAWVKRARPMVLHVPEYHASTTMVGAGFAAILLLAVLAYAMRRMGVAPVPSRWTPPAWVAGWTVLVLALPWYALMGFVFRPQEPRIAFWIPLVAGVTWAIVAIAVIGSWVRSPQWGDPHRWAATLAATLVCMGAGFAGSGAWSRVDLIGKIVFNTLAVVGFLMLLRTVRRRAAETSAS